MRRFRKIYLEISNLCNLHCRFCPGTQRTPRVLQVAEMQLLLPKLRPYADFLYFHLMGEPLCHPHLKEFLELAGEYGFRVILTTNGTLLDSRKELLLHSPALHKVNVSLHAFEANDLVVPFHKYLDDCLSFGRLAAGKVLISYRLWNQGGQEELNQQIRTRLQQAFPGDWVQERKGIRIADRVYLEYGDKFEWPDLGVPEVSDTVFCYGLRDQIGVLCDGTVVPCCLDHEGDIALGNLFRQDLEEILNTPRAKAIYEGFQSGCAPEPLCRRCGYATRFQK